ncbi:hypothetical protein B0H63DRAFT_517060 [Podospora didyma]|uniref:DUF7600 domain-containing protein n=1 Tax=Podospora didyma TaxID=330526 RepID=A0AAE0P5U7_9PEZI|nr:hypothetical protein B0H63DRAFT_517060 [Podospora didyma]
MIAEATPTSDYLNLRRVSKAFYPQLHSNSFWASMIWPNAKMPWLLEAHKHSAGEDPKTIFHIDSPQTRHQMKLELHLQYGLLNRKRVWGLIQGLLHIVNLDPLASLQPRSQSVSEAPISMATISGDLWQEPADPFPQVGIDGTGCIVRSYEFCGVFHTQRERVPRRLEWVSVSFITVGDAEYAAGIALCPQEGCGPVVWLDYQAPRRKTVEVSDLWGFQAALGPKGITALQCVARETKPAVDTSATGRCLRESHWTTLAKDNSLGHGGSYLVFQSRGCKLVSLSVGGAHTASQDEINSLRNSGMWFPGVPSSHLSLNEGMLPANTRNFYASEYARYSRAPSAVHAVVTSHC